MRNKKMIIISITSIIIITLMLIGLTFGYYLTKITGNENNKSVSVESAVKEVEIIEIKTIETGVIKEGTTKIIEPGYENIKVFTVQNIGNTEATYHIYLDNVVNTFNRTQDITYTLYRKSGKETIDGSKLNDSNYLTENNIEEVATGTFPKTNKYILTNETITSPNDYYKYALKVTYINSETEDQSEDQGKNFSYKIQLHAEIENPYSSNKSLLSYNIINNAKLSTHGTVFTENLSATNMVANGTTENDKILSTAEDDGGTTYYFRGNPEDNYVEYAGMCWRIVRIEGDGSVKLILASEKTCSKDNLTTSSGYATDGDVGVQGTKLDAHYGYKVVDSKYTNDYINSSSENTLSARTKLNDWLERKIKSESDKALLKNETWCIGDQTNAYSYDNTGEIVGTPSDLIASETEFYYTAGNKYYVTKTPSYKCETTGAEGEVDINKVGMLTFDEIVYAGGGRDYNSNYYLLNNTTNDYWWWTLSLSHWDSHDDYVFIMADANYLHSNYVHGIYPMSLRPAVTLVSSAVITSGDGTIGSPYKVG